MVAVARALQACRRAGGGQGRRGHRLCARRGSTGPCWSWRGPGRGRSCLRRCATGIQVAVHREGQVAWVEDCAGLDGRAPLGLWVKVDTGMHRLGLDPVAVPRVLARLGACPGARVLGLMTHLANADTPEDPLSEAQCRRLQASGAPAAGSPCPSATPPVSWRWRARAPTGSARGSCSTGPRPCRDTVPPTLGLRPVMTLVTQLIAVQPLRRGRCHRLRGDLALSRGHARRDRCGGLCRRLSASRPARYPGPGAGAPLPPGGPGLHGHDPPGPAPRCRMPVPGTP